MLQHLIDLPDEPRDGAPVAILLHGRGSHEGDLQGLRSHLPEGTIVVTPRAPFPGAAWGYGPGWAWYRYVERDRVVPDTLDRSLDELDALVEGLPDLVEVSPGAIFLGGFSQGGTTSLAWALSRPGQVAGAVCLSGFLVEHPRVPVEQAAGLPVFWGHGRRDPNIPYDLAVKGRNSLTQAGADLTTADHSGGHHLAPDEVRALSDWMVQTGAGG